MQDGRLARAASSVTEESDDSEVLGVWSCHAKVDDSYVVHNTPSALQRLRARDLNTFVKTCEDPLLQRWVMRPDSKVRLAWDVASMAVLAYDVVISPLDAFEVQKTVLRQAFDLMGLVFWTFDIGMMFFVGYQTDDHIEMRLHKIALRYLTSSFLLDVFIVVLEWASVGSAGILRMGKAFRLVRLMRIMKVVYVADQLNDFIRSETSLLAFRIGKSIIFILVINHFIACSWWAVSFYFTTEPRWVQPFLDDDVDISYRYFTSLHWALTQFTPASMEVVPQNLHERVFTVTVMMIGLGMFSSFLSSISSLMTHLRQLNIERQREDESLRRYLNEHSISAELGLAAINFIRKSRSASKRRRLIDMDVKLIAVLPDHMRMKLNWEVFEPAVIPHPLCFSLNDLNHSGFVELCHRTINQLQVRPGHELFHCDQKATNMYFLGYGSMDFFMGQEDPTRTLSAANAFARTLRSVHHRAAEVAVANDLGVDTQLLPGGWACEMTLWMPWVHRGTLVGHNMCTLYELSSGKFPEFISHHGSMYGQCCAYAKLYVKRVLQLEEEGDLSLHDLWGTVDDLQSLVHRAADGQMPKSKSVKRNFINIVKSVFS